MCPLSRSGCLKQKVRNCVLVVVLVVILLAWVSSMFYINEMIPLPPMDEIRELEKIGKGQDVYHSDRPYFPV